MSALNEDFVELHHDDNFHVENRRGSRLSIVTAQGDEGEMEGWIDKLVVESERGVNALIFLTRVARLCYKIVAGWLGMAQSDHHVAFKKSSSATMKGNVGDKKGITIILVNPLKSVDADGRIMNGSFLSEIICSMLREDILINGKIIADKNLTMDRVEKIVRENADYALSYIWKLTGLE